MRAQTPTVLRPLLPLQFIFNNSKVPIPEFVISPEQALDVLIAASYMDC